MSDSFFRVTPVTLESRFGLLEAYHAVLSVAKSCKIDLGCARDCGNPVSCSSWLWLGHVGRLKFDIECLLGAASFQRAHAPRLKLASCVACQLPCGQLEAMRLDATQQCGFCGTLCSALGVSARAGHASRR